MTVKAVCWDWNGTLLDDVARCLRVMNLMLADFGRPTITDVAAYRAVFRFPLHDHEIARELGTRFVHFERGHQALSGDGSVTSIVELAALEHVFDE